MTTLDTDSQCLVYRMCSTYTVTKTYVSLMVGWTEDCTGQLQYGYQIPMEKKAYLTGLCRSGHLYSAQWLVKEFKLTRKDVAKSYCGPFHEACKNGHLVVCQWLLSEFPSLKRQLGMALSCSLDKNQFPIAQWLAKEFSSHLGDVKSIQLWRLYVVMVTY